MKKDPTIPELTLVQRLAVHIWGRKYSDKSKGHAMETAKMLLPFIEEELSTQAQLHDQEMRDMEEKCDVRVGKAIRNEFEAANDDFEELLIVHKASTELKQAFAKRKNIFTTNSGEKKS